MFFSLLPFWQGPIVFGLLGIVAKSCLTWYKPLLADHFYATCNTIFEFEWYDYFII